MQGTQVQSLVGELYAAWYNQKPKKKKNKKKPNLSSLFKKKKMFFFVLLSCFHDWNGVNKSMLLESNIQTIVET